MLVDLERNDLGRICKSGSIQWKRWRLNPIQMFNTWSVKSGELCDEMDGFDALQSFFPAVVSPLSKNRNHRRHRRTWQNQDVHGQVQSATLTLEPINRMEYSHPNIGSSPTG